MQHHQSLSHLSKDQVASIAHRAHKARRNAEAKIMAVGKLAVGGAAAIGTAGLIGNWMGGLEYEYETSEKKDDIDAGNEPDPRKWGAVDKDVGVGLLIALSGIMIAAVAKKDSTQFMAYTVAQAGTGALSGAVYAKSHSAGYNRAKAAATGENT